MNLGFTKECRLHYIDEFDSKIRRHVHDGTLEQLVKFANLREDDDFVINDAKLLKLIKPSENLDNQPSHEFIQYLALKQLSSVITVEAAVWARISGKMYSGHIDFFQVIGNKIRIIDYKPDLIFDPATGDVHKHFIDSIPQVAVYAILFRDMYGILPTDYEIECVTFNQDGYYVYEPYEALESSVDFYYGKLRELPAWSVFLSQNTIEEIVARYPPP